MDRKGLEPLTPAVQVQCSSQSELTTHLKNKSSVLTTGLDLTDGLFPITCCECTAEQGPLQDTLGHSNSP